MEENQVVEAEVTEDTNVAVEEPTAKESFTFNAIGIDRVNVTRATYFDYLQATGNKPEVGAVNLEGFIATHEPKDGNPSVTSFISEETALHRYFGLSEMPFYMALHLVQMGFPITRLGWNGNGMFVYYVNGDQYTIAGASLDHLPMLVMKTADNKVVPWLASQTDLLSSDWSIYRKEEETVEEEETPEEVEGELV